MVGKIIPVLVLCATLAATSAYGCGVMEQADPKVGSSVSGPVDRLTLSFSEAVDPAQSSIGITDAAGHKPKTDALAASKGDTILSLKTAAPLPPGKYKVGWSILWKDCNSRTQGDYKFSVE